MSQTHTTKHSFENVVILLGLNSANSTQFFGKTFRKQIDLKENVTIINHNK